MTLEAFEDIRSKISKVLFFACLILSCLFLPRSASAAWSGEYWNVTAGPTPAIPVGAATMTRSDSNIAFDWSTGSPEPGTINIDGFVVRWTQTLDLSGGTYYFSATADDGIRVYLDGSQVINGWADQSPTTYTAFPSITAGSHVIRVEYYENGGGAVAQFSYQNRSPIAQTYSPADGASGVGLNDNLVLTFDKNVAAGAGSADDIVIYDSDDQVIEQISAANTSKVNVSSTVVTINPAAAFTDMKGYYVKIRSTAFYSTAYGYYYTGISDKTTWNFTTGDFTKPATSDDYGAKDGVWQDADQTITITPTDPSPSSGISWTKYCTDDGTAACDPAAGTTLSSPYQINVTAEGTTYLRYASRDASNNTQDAVTRIVKIDKTDPTVEAGSDLNTGAPFSRTASVSDAVSGIDSGTYSWTKVSGPGNVTFSDASALSTLIQTDSSGAYVISFSVRDNAGNSSSDSFTLRAGSASLPPVAYNPPSIPAGGFKVLINGGAVSTADRIVTLASFAGEDVARMAVSRTPDFKDASQEDFQAQKSWDLCSGGTSCPDGEYTLYVKFYTRWGKSSQPVSVTIALRQGAGTDTSSTDAAIPASPAPIPANTQPGPDQTGMALPAPKYRFVRQLRLGMRGEDVRQLQMFLNSHGYTVALSGPGSVGNESTYFGLATKRAVINFQKAYSLKPYPGNVGPATLKVLNSL